MDSSNREEVRLLAMELAGRIKEAMPPEYPAEMLTEVNYISWFAARQTYRFTIRVWVEVEQMYLPGMEEVT
jgi:hypothetical protein